MLVRNPDPREFVDFADEVMDTAFQRAETPVFSWDIAALLARAAGLKLGPVFHELLIQLNDRDPEECMSIRADFLLAFDPSVRQLKAILSELGNDPEEHRAWHSNLLAMIDFELTKAIKLAKSLDPPYLFEYRWQLVFYVLETYDVDLHGPQARRLLDELYTDMAVNGVDRDPQHLVYVMVPILDVFDVSAAPMIVGSCPFTWTIRSVIFGLITRPSEDGVIVERDIVSAMRRIFESNQSVTVADARAFIDSNPFISWYDLIPYFLELNGWDPTSQIQPWHFATPNPRLSLDGKIRQTCYIIKSIMKHDAEISRARIIEFVEQTAELFHWSEVLSFLWKPKDWHRADRVAAFLETLEPWRLACFLRHRLHLKTRYPDYPGTFHDSFFALIRNSGEGFFGYDATRIAQLAIDSVLGDPVDTHITHDLRSVSSPSLLNAILCHAFNEHVRGTDRIAVWPEFVGDIVVALRTLLFSRRPESTVRNMGELLNNGGYFASRQIVGLDPWDHSWICFKHETMSSNFATGFMGWLSNGLPTQRANGRRREARTCWRN